MNPETLFEAIRTLLQAKDEAEAQKVLKDHPELLEDEADLALQQLMSSAKKLGDTQVEDILAQVRKILRALRPSDLTESSIPMPIRSGKAENETMVNGNCSSPIAPKVQMIQ